MGGTFETAAGGTFETDMPGTFHSATGGTFVPVLGGTFNPLLSIFDVITQEWRDWAEQQHNAVPSSSQGKSPVIAFGGDVCYKVDEEGKIPVDPNHHVGTTEKGRSSKFRIFFGHVWDDIVTSWWKCAAYIIAMCSIVFAVASWYKTYRLEQVAKEYYIIKPLLRDDRKFGPFIHSLDSAILSSGVDDVCEKIYGRPEKK